MVDQVLHEALWATGAGPGAGKLELLLQVWIFNCFNVGTEAGVFERGVLCRNIAMCSHSCQPNAIWHTDDDSQFILQARGPIAAGEEVTITYLSGGDLCLTTPDRRRHLALAKKFHCTCLRCVADLDDVRHFRCPHCGGDAFAAPGSCLADSGGGGGGAGAPEAVRGASCLSGAIVELCSEGAEPGSAAMTCITTCGPLGPVDAAAMLEPERDFGALLRPHASELLGGEPAPGSAAGLHGRAAALLREAEAAGLGPWHWVVDALRAAAIEEEGAASTEQCRLLRERAHACEEAEAGGPPPRSVTKLARLRVALGKALVARAEHERTAGDDAAASALLREAIGVLRDAVEAFAVLFYPGHVDCLGAEAQLEKALASHSA